MEPLEPNVKELSRLIELAHDAIIVRDLAGRVIVWNRGAEAIYGWSKEEAVGKIMHALLKTVYPETLEAVERNLAGQGEWWGEVVHTTHAGAEIVVTSRQVLERDEGGRPLAVLEIDRDIPQRKQAEEWLRASEARLRALVSSMDDVVFEIDEQGTYVNVWTGNERLLVRPKAELIGHRIEEFFPPDTARALLETSTRVLDSGPAESIEYALDLGQGRRLFEARCSRISSAPGAKRTVSLLVRDITARKETETALRQGEERFRLLMGGVQDYAIFMLDPEGRVTSWNRGAERILGYRDSEIVGRHFSLLFPEDDVRSGKPQQALQIAAREGRFEDEGWRISKNGTRLWANGVITALRNQAGELIGFAKVTRDFTERMKEHEALEGAKRELEVEVAARTEAQRKSQDSADSLRDLSLKLLRVQDEERRRLGKELHDSLGQYLALLKTKLDLVKPLAEKGNPILSAKIAECAGLAEESVKELRTVSYLLYPPMLEEMGLKAAIQAYLDGFTSRSGITTTFGVSDKFPRFSREVELALFRVLQESLTNVHRHSSSREAAVRLLVKGGAVVLEVSDKGQNLPSGIYEERGQSGVGLRGMKERVQQLSGKLELSSASTGTTLTAIIPITES